MRKWATGPSPQLACAQRRQMGLQSLPVAFGVETAKWITVGTIDVTQFSVAAYLAFGLHEPVYAAVLTALILPQARPEPCQGCRLRLVHRCPTNLATSGSGGRLSSRP